MSRLFYESEAKQVGTLPLEGGPAGGRKARKNAKLYFEKVGKLIPAEIVAGYHALLGFVPGINPESTRWVFYWLAFLICLVATPLYMLWQSERGRPRQWHICLSTGSFLVWAYATSGSHLVGQYFQESIGGFVVAAYSLLAGAKKLD